MKEFDIDTNTKNDLEKSHYFDVREDDEYFPVKSMEIENEWISKQDIETLANLNINTNNRIVDSSPYFGNVKTTSENVRFVSPIQTKAEENLTSSGSNTPKINRSILNELLPTQVQLESHSNEPEAIGDEFLLNDKLFGQIFKGSFIIWAIWSIFLISSKSASGPTEKLPEVTGWFVCLLILGLGMTAVWAKLLAEQTEAIVYGLMIAVPVGFGFLGLTAISHWYILSGAVFLIISAILAAAIHLNRNNLRSTVDIVHSAAIFIQATPKVYGLVLKVVTIYVAFVIIWLMAFVRLFNSQNTLLYTTISQCSFVFMLIWFGAVVSTAQKFILATWVRSWMDQIEEESIENVQNEKNFLDDKTFGSICLAAGLLSLAKVTRIVGKGFHFTGKALNSFVPFSGIISSFFSWLLSLISIAERFMQRFTDFAIYFLALNNTDGFINSCKEISRVVSNGHIGLAVTTDTIAQLLLTFSTALISFISTVLILLIAKSHVSWSSGVLIGLLAVSVTGFVSNVYTSAIDATFLCYVMDMKRPEKIGKIKNEIQNAFSSKLSSV